MAVERLVTATELDGEDVVPGFSYALRALFEELA